MPAHIRRLLICVLVILFPASFTACGGGGQVTPTTPPVPAPHARTNVILLGDSLTQHWLDYWPPEFAHYTDKGISGQLCSDMAARFDIDVIALHPDVVVIWCGTNDVTQSVWNQAASQLAVTQMIAKARAANILVILATIPPMRGEQAHINPLILTWNAWIRTNAPNLADYYPALVDTNGELRGDLAIGYVHLNGQAYALLQPILTTAVAGAK